jgi:hypothetical protein
MRELRPLGELNEGLKMAYLLKATMSKEPQFYT